MEAVGPRQDRLRGTPGLFQRVVDGIEEYRRHGGREVTLWSNLTRKNRDQVRPLAEFAREHKVDVEFFPAALYPGYNENVVLRPEERE